MSNRIYRVIEKQYERGGEEYSDFYPQYKDGDTTYLHTDGTITEFQYFTKWVMNYDQQSILREIHFSTMESAQKHIESDKDSLIKNHLIEIVVHEV